MIIFGGSVRTVLAIVGRADFLTNLMNMIMVLAYVMIPWTAINLVDFYLVRKERYAIADIFERDGRDGGVDWRAMTADLIGVGLQFPFVNTGYFVGPAAAHLGDIDIAWVVGLVTSASMYVVLMQWKPERRGYIARLGDAPVAGNGLGS